MGISDRDYDNESTLEKVFWEIIFFTGVAVIAGGASILAILILQFLLNLVGIEIKII